MLWWYRLLRLLRPDVDTRIEALRPFEPPAKDPNVETGSSPFISGLSGWAAFDGGLDRIPVGRAEMIAVYGDPVVTYDAKGIVKVDRKWEYANLATVPAALIPGYHRRIYMHRLVAPYFKEAMRRAVAVCPDYRFAKIGCFAPRHMRHSKTRPLSDHTWAIAFDVNAEQNKAFTRNASGPLPFCPGWKKHSDLPQGVVEAFESVGFEWGGRWGNGPSGGYCDPQHFQLRKTK